MTEVDRLWAAFETKVRAAVPAEKVAPVMQVYRDYCDNTNNFWRAFEDELATKWGELRKKGPIAKRDEKGNIVGFDPTAIRELQDTVNPTGTVQTWGILRNERRTRLAEIVPIETLDAVEDGSWELCSNINHAKEADEQNVPPE